jgi:hypothetical protein
MTDQIDPTRGFKPLPSRLPEEASPRRQRDNLKPADADRVSLSRTEQVDATYGPQSGLAIGSNFELLRSLVIKTLQEQQVPLQISAGGGIDFNSMTVEEAQTLIAEDGYFGVEQTSERIVDFAINGFGQDPTRLEEMINAIDKGFQDAQQAFGGTLPEISQQTYDAIMQKLDAFAQQFEPSGE